MPPHGVPVANSTSTMAITATTTVGNVSNVSNGNNEDYKPPVPPHRNTGVGVTTAGTAAEASPQGV